jgi:hypothetical protein
MAAALSVQLCLRDRRRLLRRRWGEPANVLPIVGGPAKHTKILQYQSFTHMDSAIQSTQWIINALDNQRTG